MGKMTLEWNDESNIEDEQVEIYTMDGQRVFTGKPSNTRMELDLSFLDSLKPKQPPAKHTC